MTEPSRSWDLIVLGAGPAGQKAAVQGAKLGKRVLLVERFHRVGGECVRRGTIPSKALQEVAQAARAARRSASALFGAGVDERIPLAHLMGRVGEVVTDHERCAGLQMARNGVHVLTGHARFVAPREITVTPPGGRPERHAAEVVVIAVGSRPRKPPEIPVDHEAVVDSDSILSLQYLPRSLTVLGASVIACEYASVFAQLGTRVHLVDRGELPLGFLDAELTRGFVRDFERAGGVWLPRARAVAVRDDGVSAVTTELEDGRRLESEKVFVALGRIAQVEGLDLEAAGVALTERGHVQVDENLRTTAPGVYAAGDVIGPPALAASSMEQGRRAVRHAFDEPLGEAANTIPVGIYTLPEIAVVGLGEAEAVARHGAAVVGRARFEEIARGQISGADDGLLKLVADPEGRRLLGVGIVGEKATELVHMGQVALLAGWDVQAFVENIFNFPTMAEAYRVAALDLLGRVPRPAEVERRAPELLVR